MKKMVFILAVFFLAAGVYAQGVSLDLHYSVFGEVGTVVGTWGAPSVGIAVDMGKFDILGNVDFMLRRSAVSSNERNIDLGFGLYAGIAPKAAVSDNVTLSFPILLKYIRTSETRKQDTPSGRRKTGYNILGFDAGARAYYALSQRWSIYTGFQVGIMDFTTRTKTTRHGSYGSGSSKADDNSFYFFGMGCVDFGVKLSF